MSKSTVTVTCSWYSSNPVFEDVLSAVKREMLEKKIVSGYATWELEELLPLNGGEPFNGRTEYGPHTRIQFEVSSLAKAIQVVRVLEYIFRHKFPNKDGKTFFEGISFQYAGKPLYELVESLEKALGEAQQDLKWTRRFIPSKRIQRLRLAYEGLYK